MVALNAFSTPMMLSASNVALPAIGTHFSLTAVTLSWIPMAYLMAGIMFILIFGRIADLYGRKRVFLLGTAGVIGSSVFTALAVNTEMLFFGRFLQGVSAASLYATQIAIISSVFVHNQRGQAIGLVLSSVYIGLAAGTLLGGMVTDGYGWRANFLVHIPLSLLVLYIGLTRVKDEWLGDISEFDRVGACLFSTTVFFLCFSITGLSTQEWQPFAVLCLISLAFFVRHIRTVQNPICDVSLFLANAFFTRCCGASFIMYTGTYTNIVLISLYLQHVRSLSASQAGLILMIQPITMALFSPISGRLSDRFEARFLTSVGMALTACGLYLLSTLTAGSHMLTVCTALAMTGIGFGVFSPANTNAMMGSVMSKDYGSASGVIATTRMLGQLGSMLLVVIAMSQIIGDRLLDTASLPALVQSIQLSFGIAASICLLGIFLSITRTRQS